MITAIAALRHGETFTHTVPRSCIRYEFAEILFDGFFGEQTVGILVDGEPHDLCRRCGTGYGHYSWNGEDDICYECGGEGYGRPATEADMLRRAINRYKEAERKERKRLAWIAERDARLQAWKDANAELWAELAKHLPGCWENEGSEADALGATSRKPATTFLAKLAVQVADEHKPLTEKQTAAAADALVKTAARHAERLNAGHLGAEGEKVETTVTVTGCKSFDSDYGTRWLVSMKTAEGHVLKTWTSGVFVDTAIDRHKDGQPVRIKATVKAHVEYQGLPETTLIRVKASLLDVNQS